jgi:thiol-disulfide isomerase/thioredoxin
MVKKMIFFLMIILISDISYGGGIEFYQGTWKEAMAEAKAQDKLLFVDAFAKWCGPCKKMARDVFTRDEVGEFFNENFINLKLDMEEADGLTFGKKYPVSAYPTLMFIAGDGEVVKRIKGAQQPDALINHGKIAIASYDRSDEYAALYEEGKRDYNTVYKYVKTLNMAGKPSLKIANDYILSNPDISDEQMALFLYEAAIEADSRLFDEMLKYKEVIVNKKGKDAFKKRVVEACSATISKSVDYDVSMLKDEALDKCKEALGKEADTETLRLNMIYAVDMGDIDGYYEYVEKLGKKAKKDPSIYKYLVNDMKDRKKDDPRTIKLSLKYTEELCKKDLNAENAIMRCMALISDKQYDPCLKFVDESLEKIDKSDPFWYKLSSVTKYVEGLKKRESIN